MNNLKDKISDKIQNQSSCSDDNLYQDESIRRPNGLLYTMRTLFNKHTLTTWEFQEFRKMIRSFCKENNLYFDEEKEMIYKKRI